MKIHSSFVSHIAVVLCPWFNVEVSSCDRHFVGDFFLLFSPKKIFVKGLKFKEIHCFLKRKKSPFLAKWRSQSKTSGDTIFLLPASRPRSVSSQSLGSSLLPNVSTQGCTQPAGVGGVGVGRGCIRGLWRESGTPRGGGILLRRQPSHTLEEQTDSTFLSFFWRFLGQGQSPYSRQ